MPRNLDHRVEVLTPVEDLHARAEITTTFDALLEDTESSWEQDQEGLWTRIRPDEASGPCSAQEVLMCRARRHSHLAQTQR
jgi:polyphosphate kinase